MAKLSCHGLDDLELDMKAIAELPVEVQDEMLNAMADVTAEGQKRKAKAYGVEAPDSGLTIKSIKKGKIKFHKGHRVIYVTPSGTRKRGKKRVRNAEIAFVNEFGKKGQKARPFVRDGNEATAKESTEAGTEVYDRYLRSKNL